MSQLLKDVEVWLEGRRKYIGSSDAAGIFGCGYADQSAYSVWLSKVETAKVVRETLPTTKEQDELMKGGQKWEKYVALAFADRNPQYTVTKHDFDLRVNPRYPYLCASLDASGIDSELNEFPIEAKWILNPSRKVEGEWVNEWAEDECPMMYKFQVLHQMIVMDAQRGVVVAVVCGKYCEVWIERDEEVVQFMLEEYEKFWKYVVSKTRPPEPKSIAMQSRDIDRGTAMVVGSDISSKIREVVEAQQKSAVIKKRTEVILDYVGRRVGGAEYLLLDDGTAVKLHSESVKPMRKLPLGVRVLD